MNQKLKQLTQQLMTSCIQISLLVGILFSSGTVDFSNPNVLSVNMNVLLTTPTATEQNPAPHPTEKAAQKVFDGLETTEQLQEKTGKDSYGLEQARIKASQKLDTLGKNAKTDSEFLNPAEKFFLKRLEGKE